MSYFVIFVSFAAIKKKKNQKKASNWLFCDLLWHFSENVFGVV